MPSIFVTEEPEIKSEYKPKVMDASLRKLDRQPRFDAMRLLGIFLIIIAHTNLPMWLYTLRDFGTPLLVVTSSLTFGYIYSRREFNYGEFVKKRAGRLLLPTYAFLTIFVGSFSLLWMAFGKVPPFEAGEVLKGYLLMGGSCQYLWIIKIYLILALITGVCRWVDKRVENLKTLALAGGVYWALYETAWLFFSVGVPEGAFFEVAQKWIFEALGYLPFFVYGLRLERIKSSTIAWSGSVALVVALGLGAIYWNETGSFVPTDDYRWPPQLYYFSYAFACVNFVYLAFRYAKTDWAQTPVARWLSAQALWIYLWHAMGYYLWMYGVKQFPENNLGESLVMLTWLLGFGIGMTVLQNAALERLLPRLKPATAKWVRVVFG